MINPNLFVPIGQAVAKQAARILVYALAGAGKTFLLGSLKGRGLVLNAEGGLLSLKALIDAGQMDPDTQVLRVPPGAAGKAFLTGVVEFLRANPGVFDWVGLDSISDAAETILSGHKKATKDPRHAYGAMADDTVQIVRDLCDLPGINVYVAAKAAKVRDETTGKVTLQILVPGQQLGQALPYLFDEVLYLKEQEDGTRVFQTSRDGVADAKARTPKAGGGSALDPIEPVGKPAEDGAAWGLGRIIEKIKAS